jgi:hypothetical protein
LGFRGTWFRIKDGSLSQGPNAFNKMGNLFLGTQWLKIWLFAFLLIVELGSKAALMSTRDVE